jgi:hypothetical protein
VVVLAGLVAGCLRRPAGGHGARPHLRGLPLLAVGVAGVAASVAAPDGLATVVRGLGLAELAWFALRNRQVTGLAVAGLGALLNLVALVLNNGVTVRHEALVDAGIVEEGESARHRLDEPYHVGTDSDSFAWLGAVVPISATGQVLSFGDLVLLVGGFDALRDLGRRRARPPVVDDDAHADGGRRSADDGSGAGRGGGTDQPPAMTQARADQDWGEAPRAAAESGSQCSAKRELTTAEAMEFWRDAAVSPSPAHLAAHHDK